MENTTEKAIDQCIESAKPNKLTFTTEQQQQVLNALVQAITEEPQKRGATSALAEVTMALVHFKNNCIR